MTLTDLGYADWLDCSLSVLSSEGYGAFRQPNPWPAVSQCHPSTSSDKRAKMRRLGHKPTARLPYLSHIMPHTGLTHRLDWSGPERKPRHSPRLPSSSSENGVWLPKCLQP